MANITVKLFGMGTLFSYTDLFLLYTMLKAATAQMSIYSASS